MTTSKSKYDYARTNDYNPAYIVFEKGFNRAKYADQYLQLLQDAVVADHYIKTYRLYYVCRQNIGLSHPKALDVCYLQLDIHDMLKNDNLSTMP